MEMKKGEYYIMIYDDIPYGIMYCLTDTVEDVIDANIINLWGKQWDSWGEARFFAAWDFTVSNWTFIPIEKPASAIFLSFRGISIEKMEKIHEKT